MGDIVKIIEGMDMVSDGIMLEASDVTTDESAMTGETDPMKKSTLAQCEEKQ